MRSCKLKLLAGSFLTLIFLSSAPVTQASVQEPASEPAQAGLPETASPTAPDKQLHEIPHISNSPRRLHRQTVPHQGQQTLTEPAGVVPFLVEIGNPCLGADLN